MLDKETIENMMLPLIWDSPLPSFPYDYEKSAAENFLAFHTVLKEYQGPEEHIIPLIKKFLKDMDNA